MSYAGDASYESAKRQYTFEVTHEDTAMSLQLVHPKETHATARLTDSDSGIGVANRTVRFLVDGIEIASTQTDSSGVASAVFTKKQARPGQVVRAVFNTDDTFVGSVAEMAVPRL